MLDPVSYSSGDADFKAILTQVRSQKPDAIFVTGYYPEAAIIVRQARELGMKMPLLGGDGWVGDALKNGREALNNSYISNHYSGDNPDPVVQNFVKALPREVQPRARRDRRARLRRRQGAGRRDHARRARPTGRSCATRSPRPTSPASPALKMNAKRNVDKPAVIQEVTFVNGEVKFVYKTTINPN